MVRRALLCVASALLLLSCASTPSEVPAEASIPELFQKAQDLAYAEKYQAAIEHVQAVIDRHPGDAQAVITAQYHRALYTQQSGDLEHAATLYRALLARYQAESGLPAWIQVLSQSKLDEMTSATAPEIAE